MTPRLQKIETIKWIGARYAIPLFVETGTFQGDMLEALKDNFDTLHSIEIDRKLHENACDRFRLVPNIRLWVGDSAMVLPNIAGAVKVPTLFWLDANSKFGEAYAGNPLLREIAAILTHHTAPHAILIDDINLLGTGDFPKERDVYGAIDGMRLDVRGNILIACSPDLHEIEEAFA